MVNPRPPFASLRSEHPFPEARHLRIDLIDPNPDQPRHVLAGIEELAAHIRDHGLLQPIVVTRAGNGRFTLIAGQRRLAAVRWLAEHDDDPARWRHIPTIIRTVETAERLTLALAENLARHALSDAEVLTAIRVLVDLHGWSQHQIARRLGVSHQWVNQVSRVLAASALAEHVQTGRLSVAKAYQVQRAHSPEARRPALDAALGSASFRAIRNVAEGVSPTAADPPDSPATSADSTPTSPSPSFDRSETPRHTVPVASHLPPRPAAAPLTGLGDRVALRTLAIHTLFQEARRRRLAALPVSTLQETLLADLRTLRSGPRRP